MNGDHSAAAKLFHDWKVPEALIDEQGVFFGICRLFDAARRTARQRIALRGQDGLVSVFLLEETAGL